MLIVSLFNAGAIKYWEVGKPHPTDGYHLNEVTSITADGNELEYIFNKFEGLPRVKAPKQIWYGDFAKFILANLLTENE